MGKRKGPNKRASVVDNAKADGRSSMAGASTNGLQRSNDVRTSMRKGSLYLGVSLVVLLVLLYLLPNVLGIDVREAMKDERIVGILRVALGLFILVCLFYSLIRVVKTFTLEGETWRHGLYNAVASHMLGSDVIAIVLALAGGIALIVWGVTDIVA